MNFPVISDTQQRGGYEASIPGLDGDDSVLVGGAGNDLVIGGQGRNMLVGGFGSERVADDPSARVGSDQVFASGDEGVPVNLAQGNPCPG